jgi:hypothetical protein
VSGKFSEPEFKGTPGLGDEGHIGHHEIHAQPQLPPCPHQRVTLGAGLTAAPQLHSGVICPTFPTLW